MGWNVWGSGRDLTVWLERNGAVTISGTGNHRCYPMTDNAIQIMRRVDEAPKFLWGFRTIGAPPDSGDEFGRGLWNRFNKDTAKPLAMIEFSPAYEREEAAILSSVLLPAETFARALGMCSIILGRHDVGYQISLNFIGLRHPNAQTETPTVEEFFHSDTFKRKPYFSDEVRFSIGSDWADSSASAKS